MPRRPDAALTGLLAAAFAACSIVACASEGDSLTAPTAPPRRRATRAGPATATAKTPAAPPPSSGRTAASPSAPTSRSPSTTTTPAPARWPSACRRVPATGDRIGALFVNPGGPGGTASDFATSMALALPERHPRAASTSSASTPAASAPATSTAAATSSSSTAPTTPSTTPQDTAALLGVSQDYVDACEAAAGDVLPYLGTENVARDIDRRAARPWATTRSATSATATARPSARPWPSCSPTGCGRSCSTASSSSASTGVEAATAAGRRLRGGAAGLRRRLRRRRLVPRWRPTPSAPSRT